MIEPVVFQGNVQDDSGNVQNGAQITVTSVSTGLPVSLYSDLSDTVLSNPFNTDSTGKFEFYCESEKVNVLAENGGFSRTWNNQFLNVVSVKSAILTASNEYTGANSYTEPQNFGDTIVVPNIVINGKSLQTGTYNGVDTLKVSGNELLTKFALSSANNITDTERAINNVGWKAIADENLGTAAFLDAGTGTFTPAFSGSTGVSITVGASETYSAYYTIFNDQVFLEVDFNLNDSSESVSVGDRVELSGIPALIQPNSSTTSGAFTAGSATFHSNSSNRAIFDASVNSNNGVITLQCISLIGSLNYNTNAVIRLNYRSN